MGGGDEFARAVVKKSVAKVCVELGYSSIHESALHVMMDLLTRFLHKFGVLMRINAEDYCSRSYNEIDDALYALEQMGISIDEIFSCVREFNPGALDEDIPLFPVPLENMSNQSNQPTFNPSLDGEPPISLISQLSVLEKGENKAEEKENKSLTPVKTVETSSDEPSSNKVETPPPKQSQPTFLHINPSLASSSSGMLPTSVTLQYDEDRAVSENQMGTPKKVALLKQNLLKKPNEHLEPMSETFTGACSRKLRLGNDAGVNSPMKDDGTEKSPVIKEKQGAETEDQGSVTCKTGSSQSSSETDKQTPKKQQKENTCDVVDAAPLVKTLPIPPANAKAASAIDHETETEKVVEHRGMVIRTIKKDNALPVLQFPSLPKTNKDTKRKTSAKRKESETSSVKFQINLGNKIAGRKRNRSGATKPSLSKNVSSGQETVDSLVAGGSAMKSEPELEDASNASMLNTDSDNDNTELNSSREMEPSEDSSAETPSTYAAQESVSQPEPIKADLLNVGSSLKQEYDDESPPNKVNEAIVAEESLEESAEGQCEAIDMSVWTPKEVSKSVDTASAMFDDALASPPEGQTRIFGNIQTPITSADHSN